MTRNRKKVKEGVTNIRMDQKVSIVLNAGKEWRK